MSEINYLIFGNGWLGNKFNNYLDNTVLIREKINNIKDVEKQIVKYNPKIVINGIGSTGKPNIDYCESNKEYTFQGNVTIPTYIAEVCEKYEKYMIHIGSGCVYETNGYSDIGFDENDKPNFKGSFYSRTKIFAEKILEEYDNILQLRIRMPIDNIPSPRNLIDKLTGYKQVINVQNSITYIPDFMIVAKKLMDMHETGIFNVTNKGAITHREILQMYKDIVNPSYEMPEFIPPEKLDTIAGRSNCILYNKRLENRGIEMRHVLDAVSCCLMEYKKYI